MESQEFPVSVLPPEVSCLIFRNFTSWLDTVHLWIECRQVSTTFRSQVDYVFQTVHLPNMLLDINLKLYCPEKDYPGNPFGEPIYLGNNECHFDHLANDNNNLAIFKPTLYEDLETLSSEILQWLSREEKAADSPSVERVDVHTVYHINDTELPSFAFDKQSQELSFDWRGALVKFFAQEKLYHQSGARESSHLMTEDETELNLASSGFIIEDDTELEALESVFLSETDTKAQQESRGNAHRSRIHRQWGESGFNEEQIAACQDDSVEQTEMRTPVVFRHMLVFAPSDSHD